MRLCGLIIWAISREQRGAIDFETFILDLLVQFMGLLGGVSGDVILVIGNTRMGMRVSYFRRFLTKCRGLGRINLFCI